jgi:hypothetical protein
MLKEIQTDRNVAIPGKVGKNRMHHFIDWFLSKEIKFLFLVVPGPGQSGLSVADRRGARNTAPDATVVFLFAQSSAIDDNRFL